MEISLNFQYSDWGLELINWGLVEMKNVIYLTIKPAVILANFTSAA